MSVKVLKLQDIPEQVNREHLREHRGKLLSPETTRQIREKLNSGELKFDQGVDQQGLEREITTKRFTSKQLEKLGISSDYNVMVVKNPAGAFDVYAIYLGQSRALGSGTFGTVKLIQNQDNDEFDAIKNLEIPDIRAIELTQITEAIRLQTLGMAIGETITYTPESTGGKKNMAMHSEYKNKRDPS